MIDPARGPIDGTLVMYTSMSTMENPWKSMKSMCMHKQIAGALQTLETFCIDTESRYGIKIWNQDIGHVMASVEFHCFASRRVDASAAGSFFYIRSKSRSHLSGQANDAPRA